MNKNEIRNMYTSVESINARIKEINDIYETTDKNVEDQANAYAEEVTKFLHDNNISDWKCYHAGADRIQLQLRNSYFYCIDITARYEDAFNSDYTKTNKIWKFTINVSSYGETHITEPTEDDKHRYEYYKMVAKIMGDIEFSKNLETICKENVNKLLMFRNIYHPLRNEERELENLRDELRKKEDAEKFLKLAKDADKSMFVIINKYEDPSICVATYRKTPCVICCEPNESKLALTQLCKEQNKYMCKHYNVVEIKNLKFD